MAISPPGSPTGCGRVRRSWTPAPATILSGSATGCACHPMTTASEALARRISKRGGIRYRPVDAVELLLWMSDFHFANIATIANFRRKMFAGNLRILIASTEKTGNTWLKFLLARVYDL